MPKTTKTQSLPFLPFTRPTIDDATIAEVGKVLRSGWITTGPHVKALEDENRRLKQLVADQALDIQMLKHISEGNW